MKAVIVGISGLALTPGEADVFKKHPPAGVILFSRNVAGPEQLAALMRALRNVLLPDAVLMVDQEGGRVARLRPPHWRAHPPAAMIGALYDRDRKAGLRTAWLTGALIGLDCAQAGFDVACAPVLDLRYPGAHDIIGDRAFGADPESVAALGAASVAGLRAAGIQPVIKHIPGHGRALADSHLELPVVDARALDRDLLPFARNADAGWAMTAHIVYSAWDALRPATMSPKVIDGVIRGKVGFMGVLVSDDLTMRALSGSAADLAQQALAAGCDLALHCSGAPDETAILLESCPEITATAAARMRAAAGQAAPQKLDDRKMTAERDRLLA